MTTLRMTFLAICVMFTTTIVIQCNCELQNLQQKEKLGKELYIGILKKGESSSCWLNVLENIHERCAELSDTAKMQIALGFTECHFSQSGVEIERCTNAEYHSPSECTKRYANTPIIFSAYTEFYIHVDNICYYLEARNFQKRSEDTIADLQQSAHYASRFLSSLSEQSASIVHHLDESIHRQNRIEESQKELETKIEDMNDLQNDHFQRSQSFFQHLSSLSSEFKDNQQEVMEMQQKLSDEQKSLSSLHVTTLDNVNRVFLQTQNLERNLQYAIELQNSAFQDGFDKLVELSKLSEETMEAVMKHEQSLISSHLQISDTLHQIAYFQNYITRGFVDFQTIIFYFSMSLICYFLTSSRYTSSARLFSFILLGVIFWVEKSVVNINILMQSFDTKSDEIWFFRKLFFLLFMATLAISIICYKDFASINYKLLQDIRSSTQQLHKTIEYQFDQLQSLKYNEGVETEDEDNDE